MTVIWTNYLFLIGLVAIIDQLLLISVIFYDFNMFSRYLWFERKELL